MGAASLGELASGYLSDPRDRVLFAATPLLAMPRFGALPPPREGEHRFVAGRSGLFLEARSRGIDARVLIAPSPIALPYGEVTPGLVLRAGALPGALLDEAERRARRAAPDEWAGVILLEDGRYHLHQPRFLRTSPGGVSYATEGFDAAAVVLDVHSHGDGGAGFSAVDDVSDHREGGIFLAGVIGTCRAPRPRWAVRLVVNGHFFPIGMADNPQPRDTLFGGTSDDK